MTVQSTEQGNIVDLGAGGKMNTGIAPTTPSSVDGTIQSNAPAPPQPIQSNQPAMTPTTPTTPAAPAAAAPAANRPHPLARALDAVLKSATGGDVYYTDPQGNRQLAPQSRGQLGKTLIAATLAGLLHQISIARLRMDRLATGQGRLVVQWRLVRTFSISDVPYPRS